MKSIDKRRLRPGGQSSGTIKAGFGAATPKFFFFLGIISSIMKKHTNDNQHNME